MWESFILELGYTIPMCESSIREVRMYDSRVGIVYQRHSMYDSHLTIIVTEHRFTPLGH